MLKNSIWSFINIIGIQIFAVIVNALLARILYPEIFGILGMATVFTGLVLVFQDSGLNAFLIHKSNISQKNINAIFWLNILISLLLSLLLILIATPVSNFYQQPEVSTVIYYVALGVIIGSFGMTYRAVLVKNREFKKLTIIDMVAELASSVMSITLAIYHFELLAVTGKLLMRPLFQSVLLLITSGKYFLNKPSFHNIKEMISYSSRILGSQIFIYFNNNIDYFLIGKLLGSKSLGLYTIAFQWSVLARFYIAGAISKVAFPEISKHKDDLDFVRNLYLNIISRTSFLTFPICIGLLIVAPEFIKIVYGDNWESAIPVLQVLLIAGMISSIINVGGAVFNGLGKPEIDMWLNIISFVFLGIAIFIGSNFGILGVALGILIRSLIFGFVQIYIINKTIRLPQIIYLNSLLPNLYSTIIMGVSLCIVRFYFIGESVLLNLIIIVTLGISLYIFTSYFINKSEYIWWKNKLIPSTKKYKLNI
ncbi:lipopolysaccharide biosynthesis protein [Bacillus sp. AFS037270]|uniref:lipopolysaccharide biosynthesis protein n=1 Tax=Bacillus sp. AFS037270 TaxID=2033499 RepID=UPI000BFE230E|nr:lipopolysaccharide biosynthesis protein [Bacillus sp. AFS037270]PGV53350.1 lipopolysaccharide biosynthesis protein [Bacillus sp. AFS037270]